MDTFLSRYRNLTVLLVVVAAQLLLLGYQVKTNRDVRLIRVWSVSAVTPLAQVLESMRHNTIGLLENYFVLLGAREENLRLRKELGQLKLKTNFLENQLATADRARALAAFQVQTPSKTLAARIIANGTGSNSAAVFLDRGANDGVESGMAVVTPDGIVGKIAAAYPAASLMLLVTDPTFAAGVVSQKNHVLGTLRGRGHGACIVDYVQVEQRVDAGEWFYTSGYDRVFPRGFPVGRVSAVRNGRNVKEIALLPAALQGGLDEVLIVLDGVHERIPDRASGAGGIHLNPPPPPMTAATGPTPDTAAPAPAPAPAPTLNTGADILRERYKRIGEAEKHVYGQGTIPNFNVRLPGDPAPNAAGPAAAGGKPAAKADAKPAAPAPERPPPVLVTDPADADPDAPALARPKPPVKPAPAPANGAPR